MHVSARSSRHEHHNTSPPITFDDRDYEGVVRGHDDPLVITAKLNNKKVSRLFVDQGSSADIIFQDLYEKMELRDRDLQPYDGQLVGFSGQGITPRGYVEVWLTIGDHPLSRTIQTRFLVVHCESAYNAIVGRPTLNRLKAIVSTPHLCMKFLSSSLQVCTVRGDHYSARSCYQMSLRPHFSKQQAPPSKKSRGVHMVELDVRADEGEFRPQPEGEKITLQLGRSPGQVVYLGRTLPAEQRLKLETSLRENRDLFAWSAADMPGIDPSVICHKLTTNPGAKPVAQRRRKMGADRIKEVASKVAELLEAGFIREITYTTWLANVVMVKKPSGKWRMCVDYTNLNKVCPKDPYPLPNIDHLVDNSSGYQYLSFMDAYSGYNQIPMYPPDQEKTAFITDQAAYCYTVMPFGLKNVGATYQRMMSKVFDGQIGDHMEVYMDDMIAKSLPGEDHVSILESIFKQLRKYNMRLNPEKCTFGVEAGKFLGFLLTSRGIEANPAKCQAIINMRSPHTVKEVQQLNGRLAALSRFLPSAAKHSLPLFQLLRKSKKFEWSAECEAAFQTFKQYLAAPPILSKPEPDEVLFVYLAVSDEVVAAVLIKETADGQNPVYFISKALQGPELRYQKLEKVAYALLVATRGINNHSVALAFL
ncbi:unnamed protein product [Lupinus luteus]|uniref:Reverse transcriptase domain-containing protein n=1 Tax=Lupinus luteus TaxID=3873 RepID=A0AAV1YBE7_LUPLU